MVSYYTGPILKHSIQSVLAQEVVSELVIVNNGNPEDVTEELDDLSGRDARVTHLSGQGNIGFARACNLGASRSHSEYLLILNPDCILPDQALAKAVEIFANDRQAWLAGAQMLCPNGMPQGGSKRRHLSPSIALSHALRMHRFIKSLPHINMEEKEGELSSHVPAISGAFMLIKAERYQWLGGLDEGYFLHVEDLDLCRLIERKGGKVLYMPEIKVTHYASSSTVSSQFVEAHKTRGFIYYFLKHYSDIPKPYLWLLKLGIYLRHLFKIPIYWFRSFLKKNQKSAVYERRRNKWFHTPVFENKILDEAHRRNLDNAAPILLTGAMGQVGLTILRHLKAYDVSTYAMFHAVIPDFFAPNIHWIQGDIKKHFFSSLPEKVETVIHTPAIWHLPAMLPFLRERGVKQIVAFSSTSIEGKSETRNSYEKELVNKFMQAEKELTDFCNLHAIKLVIMRPTLIYGSGLDKNVTSIVNLIKKIGFFPISMPGLGMRQPVHIEDLAHATMMAITSEFGMSSVYNLPGKTILPYKDMVNRLASLIGKPRRALRVPFLAELMNAVSVITGRNELNGEIANRMNRDLIFNAKKAEEELGYDPLPFLPRGRDDLGL